MPMTRALPVALLFGLVGGFGPPAIPPAGAQPQIFGQEALGEFSHLTLRGVDTVTVRVSGIDPGLAPYGVEVEAFQRRVEQQLEQAGLRVVDLERARALPGAAMVEVRVYATVLNASYYNYSVVVQVKQKLQLPSDPLSFVSIPVWTDKVGGVMMQSDLRKLPAKGEEAVANFLADHARQNRD